MGGNSCNPGNPSTQFLGVGGTSASAPAFAGILALVNQHTNSRQGNANYVFYKLAANQPGVFNDVPSGGTISMPCLTGSPNCTTVVSGHQYGVLSGYSTGTGYDLATGLGSVNVANLVNKWNTVSFNASTTVINSLLPTSITHGQTVNVTVKVTGSSGTPTGMVTLFGGASGKQLIDSHALDGTGTATWASTLLPGGSYGVKAHYSGDGNYGSSDSAASSVVVDKENSSEQVDLVTFNPNTGQVINANATSAVYGSSYLLRVNILNSTGAACSSLQTGCPSGGVTLTDNGSPLDGGTFTLNSLGYFEDQSIQLSGGAHALQAVYAGDDSFKPSAPVVDAITITAAPTTMVVPLINGFIGVGSVPQLQITVQSSGTGAGPTGTVTFFVNGAKIIGSVSYNPSSGSATNPPSLMAFLIPSSSPFPAPGTYTVSASYSGDANYGASSASAPSVTVKYSAPVVTLQTPSGPVSPGNINLIATAATSSSVLAPTGTFSFISRFYGQLAGTPVYTTVKDQNGNLGLQASLSYPINFEDSFSVQYSGDSNYPNNSSISSGVTVSGNDFGLTLSQTSLTVLKGQFGSLDMVVGVQSGTPLVTFGSNPCTGLPAETLCGVAPGTFPSGLNGSVDTTFTVTTTAPHSSSALKQAAKNGRSAWWVTAFGTTFVGIFLLGAPMKKRRGSMLSLVLFGLLAIGMGCGGGGSNSSSSPGPNPQTDPGTPAGTYPITITATAGTITHTAKFTLIVQ